MSPKKEWKKFRKKISHAFSDGEERAENCFEYLHKNNIDLCSIKTGKELENADGIKIKNLPWSALTGGTSKFVKYCLKEFKKVGYADCNDVPSKAQLCLEMLDEAGRSLCNNQNVPLKAEDVGNIDVSSTPEDASFILDCHLAITSIDTTYTQCHHEGL